MLEPMQQFLSDPDSGHLNLEMHHLALAIAKKDKYVYTYPLQPQLWKRFIDDIFLIWPHGMNSLTKFIEHLNTVHPTIKFTSL